MLDLGDLMVFTKVVEAGNLTRAGRLLGMPKSTVSRRLSRLEEHLGAQLLHRSTRKVTVTDDGALFFEYCLRSIGVLRDGERALQVQQTNPQGMVRVALPYALGQGMVGQLLTEFLTLYPDMRLISVLSNDPVELLKEGYDLAITDGPLADSGMIATKLGAAECGLFAAPTYFERTGRPQSHVDLRRFDLLALGNVDRPERWQLYRGDDEVTVEFTPKFMCSDLMLLRHAALAGLGIANLPAFVCKHDLAEGRIVDVLPGWRTAGIAFFAVFPDHMAMPVRVRALIDFLVNQLRKRLSWDIQ